MSRQPDIEQLVFRKSYLSYMFVMWFSDPYWHGTVADRHTGEELMPAEKGFKTMGFLEVHLKTWASTHFQANRPPGPPNSQDLTDQDREELRELQEQLYVFLQGIPAGMRELEQYGLDDRVGLHGDNLSVSGPRELTLVLVRDPDDRMLKVNLAQLIALARLSSF